MLGKTQHQSGGTRARAVKSRERSVDFHVTIPASDDAVARRLVKRIQNSIERTIASEKTGAATLAPAAGNAAEPVEARTAKPTPPGCGAWWAF